ncbi:MAG: system NifU family Fe-S cluster assembly protein [Gemmatimonadetes bacterium]|jgi:nitrogen fixation NifU-like protein|nr:system NifU family Fe-S cluster assembly protein [Gemmatimonadota bacterium]
MAPAGVAPVSAGTTPPYLALVVEHYRRPRNNRSLAAPTHVHEGVNALCGDRLRVELEVRDGVVVDAAFQASACAIATASASLLTERLRGATIGDAHTVDEGAVIAALGAGVPVTRRGCATLALRMLQGALGAGT